ncbi:DsbA family oxidoreductase [Rhodoligotrophos ferricapiens]|uniref:DsbA family oxidoreductase n=1 Tax=Rhodoligotrophos ferricapiens TaxID=3069264 RepID=UPI00315D42E7
MTTRPSTTIDVVSDVVCPWCYVGKRRLSAAIALRPDVQIAVRWHPFQLDPTIPAEGVDRKAYLARKFGSEERVAEIHEQIKAAGESVGISFAFDLIARSPNTLSAHRLIHAAPTADIQDRLVERLFALYFTEGRDIGNAIVLADAAADAGLERAAAAQLIAGDDGLNAVRQEISAAQNAGIRGVPCFIFGQRYAVSGAQPPELMADMIDRTISA